MNYWRKTFVWIKTGPHEEQINICQFVYCCAVFTIYNTDEFTGGVFCRFLESWIQDYLWAFDQ